MLVAKYYNNNDIRLEDLPTPQIGPGEILVKVRASGICGTDAMEWYRLPKAPRILGHEIAGEIVESKSDHYHPGQRVFVSHHVPCNDCKYCREDNQTACDTLHSGNYDPGGYSEFVRVPKINVDYGVYVLPDQVSYIEGTMIEPLACGVRGLGLIDIRPQHTVLILGCGISGILNIQLAKLAGARVIATDINEYRLKKAQEFGADVVVHAAQDLCLKAERVIVCTGAYAAVEQAFRSIDKKGIILFFAIPNRDISIPIPDFWRNELTVTTSYGAAPADLEAALDLIATRKINVKDTITQILPLTQIQEGFKIVAEAKDSLKVVLEP
ncbi:MAG: alcohol dehydrogenase catalytic domain-containing protein [Syntrophobacterales bacterium]|jgi:L-iditol 2-dehydrogenase|nr:alcohol dehydrogenase catalytic domain-containing protein [Syntrophobacterales bacterium]